MKEYITTYEDMIINVLKIKEGDIVDCTLSINGKMTKTQFTFMSGTMFINDVEHLLAKNEVYITIQRNNVIVKMTGVILIPLMSDELQKKFVVKVGIHSVWTNIYVIQLEDDDINVEK